LERCFKEMLEQILNLKSNSNSCESFETVPKIEAPENPPIQTRSQSSLLDISMRESIYIPTQNRLDVTMTYQTEPQSIRESYSCCKDLSSTMGVKLALKFENGKAKLVTVPSGNITDSSKSSIVNLLDSNLKSHNEKKSNQI